MKTEKKQRNSSSRLDRLVRLNDAQLGYTSGYHPACAQIDDLHLRCDSPMRTPLGWHRCVICGGFSRGVESGVKPADFFEPNMGDQPRATNET